MKNNFLKTYYNLLMNLKDIFIKSDNKKRVSLIKDVLILLLITCLIKIPLIFIRDIGDNLISKFLDNNLNFLAVWGLLIEIIYIIVALSFFIKTLIKWVEQLIEKEK